MLTRTTEDLRLVSCEVVIAATPSSYLFLRQVLSALQKCWTGQVLMAGERFAGLRHPMMIRTMIVL